jgi:hypothetical protein
MRILNVVGVGIGTFGRDLMCLSVIFHEDLVQMPSPIGMSVHLLNSFLADLGRKNRTEPIPPKPNRLVTDIDPSLVQQDFNISKRKRKSHVHHHCQADNFRRRLEVAKWGASCHPQTLRNRPALFKSVSSDTASGMASRIVATILFRSSKKLAESP